MNNYHQKKIKAGTTFLQRWTDSDVIIWEYQLTHTHLTFRLEKKDTSGNLHIVCIEPLFYNGAFKWSNCNYQVSFVEDLFILRDETTGYEIQCEDINFYENCKPIR